MELTKNELEIMDVLWRAEKPLSRNDIITSSGPKSWKDSSIHILLNSLLKKEAIREAGFVRSGKGYGRTFEPTLTCGQYYSEFFSKSAQRTSVPLIVSALFQENEISLEDIDELEQLLEEKRRELQ